MTTELATRDPELLACLMTEDEAREAVAGIKRSIGSLRAKLVELHEREGWRALGYASIEACCAEEFGWKRSHLFRQLTAGAIERNLQSPIGDSPESHLRPLAGRSPEVQREAWAASEEDGQRSAASVKRAVEKAEGKASENASEGVEKSGRANDRQDAEDQSPGETQSEPLPDFLGDTQAVTQSEPETQSGPLDYTANAIRDLGEIEAAVLKRNNISVGKAAGLFSQIVAAAEQGGATWEARLRAACRPGLK